MTTAPRLSFLVDSSASGDRIDVFLARQLRNYTKWRLRRLVACLRVFVDHQPATCSMQVRQGQRVVVTLDDPPDKLIPSEPTGVSVLHVDPWLAVINKAPDVVVHPTGPIDRGTVCHQLQAWLDERTAAKGIVRPGIVHRLDRDTSGCLVVAFEAETHRGLSLSFENSQVSKSYLAIVHGLLDQGTRTIRAPIGRRSADSRVLMSCRGEAAGRKPAVTKVRALMRFPEHDLSLVRCVPLTGRNHQIRVHLASIGHPLLCDEYYATRGALRTVHEVARDRQRFPLLKRQALHAERIAFRHPIGDATVDIVAPPPSDFRSTLCLLAQAEPSQPVSSAC